MTMEVTRMVDRVNDLTVKLKLNEDTGKEILVLNQDGDVIWLDVESLADFTEDLLTAARTMLKPGLDV